jgi:hypothetical protein
MSDTKRPLWPRQPGSMLAAAALTAALAGCGSSGTTTPSGASTGPGGSTSPSPSSGGGTAQGTPGAPAAAPAPAGSNPPGDIPDTTIYVPYRSAAGHLQVKVPEGWSRTTTAASTTFASNLNSVTAAWMPMAAAPTVSSVRATTVRTLQASTQAFRLQSIRAVSLAGGPAIEVIYQVNSTANQVTGRTYRLVVERFELYRNGRGAALSLSSAVGSDNVDPWRIVSESFRWM